MKNLITLVLTFSFIVFFTGCANKPDVTQRAPGFLPNYTLLEPIDSPEGSQIYVYKNPAAKRSDYHAVILEPVIIYEGAMSEDNLTHQHVEDARANIDAGIERIVSEQIQLTPFPTVGVARLQVAITGATLEEESLKPWNIIPVSAAITLAKHASGLENKTPILVVELKFTDSVNNMLLREIVTTINGEDFRREGDTSAEFANLANTWVEMALDYANR